MNEIRRFPNLFGLRGRMVLFFSLGAFAAALALSIVTFASTRSYLLSQRSEVAKRQAFNNAQLVRTLYAENPADVDATIEKAMSINDQPVVVDFRVHRDAMVWPMVAAGTSNDEIMIARATAPDWDSQEL